VSARAIFENENQFMLRTVERSHPSVILIPHADVLQLVVDAATRRGQLEAVSPVHANEVDRTVDAERGQVPERRFQKLDELDFRHFAGGHLKLSMLDGTQTADMAVDLDVVRRIDKHHLSFLRFEQTVK